MRLVHIVVAASALLLAGCVTMQCDDKGCTGSFNFPWPEALAPASAKAKATPVPTPVPVIVTNAVQLEK